jgi:hypothetical protein
MQKKILAKGRKTRDSSHEKSEVFPRHVTQVQRSALEEG